MSVGGSDLALFARDLALNTREFVTNYVGKALTGLSDRYAALEAKLAAVQLTPGPQGERGERGADGAPGRDGIDGAPGRDGLSVDVEALQKSISVVHGRDGRDGTSVTVSDLLPLMTAAIDERFKAIQPAPAGRDGVDGRNGEKGADGAPGRDGTSITLDDLRPLVLELVQAAWAAQPPARDGRDGLPGVPGPPGEKGLDGRDGKDGAEGLRGKDGRDGIDGKDGAEGLRGKDGRDGIDGKDGEPGTRGKDGTTFERFDFSFDEQLGPIVHLKQGDQSLDAPMVAAMWDAGVWRAATKFYPRGASVSWNGSLWIAQRDAHGEKPGDGSGVWRLAVKAGRDAKPPREGS